LPKSGGEDIPPPDFGAATIFCHFIPKPTSAIANQRAGPLKNKSDGLVKTRLSRPVSGAFGIIFADQFFLHWVKYFFRHLIMKGKGKRF
jgi:hypothetical protein